MSEKLALYVTFDMTEYAAPVSTSISSALPSTSRVTMMGIADDDLTISMLDASESLSSETAATYLVFLPLAFFFFRQAGAMRPFCGSNCK